MEYFRKTGSIGGKARAKKYTKEQLSEMGRKGGRPKGSGKSGTKQATKKATLRRSPKLTHPYSPKVTQAFGTDPALARDDHDGTSRCRRSGRSHVESAAGGSSRTREWETGSERAAS
jgi:hypothetical protein